MPTAELVYLEKLAERPSGRRAAAAMEAVPRMPMIWLDLKEAGDFHFQPAVKKVSAPPPRPRFSRVSLSSAGAGRPLRVHHLPRPCRDVG